MAFRIAPGPGWYGIFTIFYCDPNGLKDIGVGNIIVLTDGYRLKQFVDHPDAPYGSCSGSCGALARTAG